MTWFSDDESIVTIDNGKMKGLKPGKTIIYAKACDADNLIVELEVSVITKEQKKALADAEEAINNIKAGDIASIKDARDKYMILEQNSIKRYKQKS